MSLKGRKICKRPSSGTKLKNEFSGVTRSYLPMHSIIRVDEVEKEGPGKILDAEGGSNVRHFPMGGQPIPKGPSGE